MKTRINVLSLISFFAIVALVLFSCTKEELVPVNPLNKSIAETAKDQPFETGLTSTVLENEQGSEFNMSYAEALESIDPDAHPDWGVAIKSFTCIRNGMSLLVYNPYNSGLDFYNSDRFLVLWFKDGKPVRSNQIRLECVCKGKYAVIVLNKATKQGIGIAFHSVRACYADDLPSKVATDTN